MSSASARSGCAADDRGAGAGEHRRGRRRPRRPPRRRPRTRRRGRSTARPAAPPASRPAAARRPRRGRPAPAARAGPGRPSPRAAARGRRRCGPSGRRPTWSPTGCTAATPAPGRATAAARRRRRTTRGCAASRPCRSRPRAAPCPDASAHAAPPLDPPAERVGSTGFSVVPKTVLNVCDPAANSGTLVLPITTTPARRTRSTSSSSASGTWSAYSGEPYVVRQPATACVSLNANGSPCSGPTSAPGRQHLVGRRGPARARSSSSETIAFSSGLRSAIRSRCSSSSSRAEIVPANVRRRACVARGRVDREVSVAHQRRRPNTDPTTTPSSTSPAPTAMPLRKSSCEPMPRGLRRSDEDARLPACGDGRRGGGRRPARQRPPTGAARDRGVDVAEELPRHPLARPRSASAGPRRRPCRPRPRPRRR